MNGNSLRSVGRFYKRHRLSLISCGLLLCLAGLAGLYTNDFSTIIQRAFAARAFRSTQSDRPSLATKTAPASDAIWREVSPRADGATAKQSAQSAPRLFRLDTEAITNILKSAPLESPSSRLENSPCVLTLPLPDGTTARFRIQESPIMEAPLAAHFPEIKSYRGRGVDDPGATLRFDWAPRGLRGLVLSRSKAFSILPQKTGDIANYLVADAADLTDQLRCEVSDSKVRFRHSRSAPEQSVALGSTLRTYRIAVATTQEYTNDPALGGGTQAGAIASINSWLNLVNAIYERELSVRLTLIASNINVVFTAEPDGFTNGSASAMVDQARTVMKNNFASTAYDIGHALGTGAGGTAYVGVTCDNTDDGPGPFKAGGVSLVSSPVGSSAYVGLIAHEIGHQFSATHTHNAAAGSCAASRTLASAHEPGSGSTIMSHAGVCGAENITSARELRFHAASFEQISNYITSGPGVCSTNTPTGNNLPTVNGGADRAIPRNTPFTLTATGDDIDSIDFSNLTYVWEQIDAGGVFGNPPYSDAGDGPASTRPIFRPFTPSLSLSRTFPSFTYILNNANVPPPTVNGFQTAENLPNVTRSLNFRVTIRDNRGGVNDDSVLLSVDGNSGPFLVTAPNTVVSWTAGSTQTVTWSVNNTNLAPVNCANVKLSLSTDGGATFPHMLAASTPNDGSEAVTLPTGISGTTARVKVEAIGNIFFDISDANFTILPAGSCPIATSVSPLAGRIGDSVTITGMNFTGVNAVKFWSEEPASFTVNSDTQITATVAFASVNGPITITKPTCPDAQTSSFVVTSGTPVTLANDDGTYESSFNHGVTSGTSWYVTRLTPASYPATLSHVNIYFAPFTNITVGTNITVVAGANADGDADINGTSFLTTNATVNALNQFNSYSVTPVTINSGDFVVGFSIAHNSAVFPGLLDTTAPNPGRSYASTNGTSFTLVENLGGGVIPGDLAIRGQVYIGNNCAISISPQDDDFPASGGSDTVVVSAGPGCSWAATSNASWITIISGAQGSGNGTVQYSVATNTGLFRTGTITVAGYTLTVTQDTGCGFTLTPTAQNFTTSGGTGSVAVGMTSTCPWTAAAVNRVEPSFPQVFLNTTYVPPTGTTTFVAAGANLQAAINAAQPGDVLELEAGATFTGNFTLPAKSGSDWIIIRSSAPDSSLPPPGTRITPSYASVMPKLVTPNNQPALSAADGAHHYRLIGIEFAIGPAVTQVFNLVLFGAGQTSLAQLPHNLILDRVYIHGNSTVELRRGVALNSASTAIIDSHISDCHEEFADSQAIMCWNGSGPFKIVNNYLEGAAENVLFGGADPTITNLVPADIEFRRNHLFKPLTWKPDHPSYGGKRWVVKNLFELKNAQRVLIDGNIFENNWLDGQTGYAILFTVRNQDGGAPWSAVQDVTFTNNIVRHSSAGLNMHGEDNNFPSAKTRRVRISNNLFDDINPALWRGGPGNFLQINAGPNGVIVEHNTAFQTNSVLVANNLPPGEGLTFTNNLAPNNEFGVFGSDKGQGTVALNYYFPGYIFRKNVLVEGLSSDYPADNFFPPTMAAVGFMDFAGGNYRLASSSPYKNAGTDGKDIGVDFDALNAAFVASAPPAPPASMPQWITITSGASGSGPGTVNYSIAPNTGLARTGTMAIAGRTFTVMQEGVCAFTISPTSQIFAAGAGSGSVSVTSGAGCDWTATSNAAWITITGGSSGSGSGAVQFSVAANTGGQRAGTMTIAGQTFTVTQNGGCAFTLNPASQSVAAAGGTGSVSITTTAGCAWTAASNAAWITITAGASGSGNGTTQFAVATNTGLQRTGTITIADQTFTVTQASGCAGALSPTSQNAPPSGGSGSVDVAIATGCAWTAASNDAWITITSGASGSGNGTTQFSVAANTGPQRAGTMTIAGQTFAVTQASGCLFSINPASQSFTPSGGSGSVNVASATGCAWTAVSNDSWITITAGASGSGSGTTNFSVAINTGLPRTGSLTVAGQTFTVTQASGCAFIISPVNQNITASGGSGSVSVTTTTGCAWTAASNDVWITITAGAGGSGSGAVQFSVGANTGPQRTGTMTVAGQTFTVTQDSGCSFTISPTSQSFTASGGAGSVTVTSTTGCPWTAASNDSWITITAGGSGSGNGTAQFSVAANTGPQRAGTMTIAGQTFTVTQSSGCSFSINPTSQTFTASGGTGAVSVTTATGCAWTATSNAAWITITAGASGSGSGTVQFSVAANTGAQRTGTMTVAGQTFNVTQDSGCSFTISPTSQTVPASGGAGSVIVTTAAGCAWTATSNAAWITITAGASGSGGGTVQFSVAANTGPQRAGTMTVAGQTFTVTNNSGCAFAINPTGQSFVAAGGNGSVEVTTATDCPWTATSNAVWITITSGASGVGSGVTQFSVAANSGPQRTGTMTIAGQTFTVTQANGCSFAISPTSQSVVAAGGTGSVSVTTVTGCAWTAASNDSWITITAGASGSGGGTVQFAVAANTNFQRTGTMTVAGQTFTITQASGCTLTISPASQSFATAGGTGSISVTATTECAWAATSNAAWITITAGASGSGSGTVQFSVAANSGPLRTSTISVAGQIFTVTQSSGCSYSINPTSHTFTASGGSTNVNITTAAGCPWAAESHDGWISITSGASGSGPGVTVISVAPNTGSPRGGDLTIAGVGFFVTQTSGCIYSISPMNQNFTASGGSGSVTVTTQTGCAWTATSNASWITITSGASGTGGGLVNFSVAANTGPQRTGTVTIAEQTFTVTQNSGCSFTISPTSQNFGASGGSGSVNVTTATGCAWTATSNAAWITVTAGASGSGGGTVQFTVAANTGPQRTGTITIAGQTFTVTQDSGCSFSINPTSQSFTASGGSGSVNVTTTTGCSWTASSGAAWITITSGGSGSGNGVTQFTVAANTGPQRTGTMTIAGQTFTVTQASGCAFTISPTSQFFTASGGAGSVNVTTVTGCAWTATSNAAWITVSAGASGSGNGTVQFTVAANQGASRTGTMTVAGQTFTVTQTSGCAFTLSPTSQSVPASGGSGSVNVTTATGCAWTATSNDSWIAITAGASGSGNGTAQFSAAANNGPQRTGAITIAGQTFTVTQASGCLFTISPTSQSFGAGGGSGSVNVTTATGCAWAATSNAAWITITGGASGSGAGTTQFSVAANTGPQRAGTMTIAGQTFTVTQAGGCSFIISPTSQSFTASSGTGSVNVTTVTGCSWTAASNDAWITILSGANGSGSGAVNFSIAANTGPPRTGTITAAGQTFTVTQSSGCSFTINPTSQTFTASGGSGSVTVTTVTGCAWTSTSNVAWITVSGGASGSGNGTTQFSVAANTGPQRTGTMTIAGQTFTVTQASGCLFTISPTSQTFTASGGSGSVNVTTATNCVWTATSNVAWITISSGASGTGNGVTQFSVAANTGPQRTGTMTIAGQTFTVTQSNGCAFTISPTSQSFMASGGTGSVNITTATGCAWTVGSNDSWITINSGASGSGSGAVNFSVAANTGPQRMGTITVAGQTFTVTQSSGCSFTINPTTQSFTASGGTGSVNVTTVTGCVWTAVSNDAWITISSGASGNGNGATQFSVAANIGPQRTGTITIAGQIFTVTQPSGCSFSISPTSQNVGASGGSGSVNVTTATGCAWTATSNDSWITITAGASGSGPGVVQFSVTATTGPQRTGTMTVAGQTFTVTQDPGCSFSISPTSQSVAASGGTGSVSVTTTTGCAWTATSNAAWITISSGASGSGNGAVQFSVSANTGPQRTGTMTIAGQTFTVTQSSGCSFTISPTSQSVGASGGSGSVNVTTATGCAWTATSNDSWITISSGASGSGNGVTQFSVAANTGPQRTGTMAIAGQTFTVTQASGCSFTISPTSQSFSASSGTGSVNVTTATGCAWTAASNDSWITISSGASGSGNGVTQFSVAANTGLQRTGTITVAGQTFTVTQSSGCSLTINPASLPGGLVGVSYNQTITATGGVTPYTFSVSAGTLPAGLTLATSGALNGAPTTAGSFTFTVQATDVNGCMGTRGYTVVICPTITVNPASLPGGSIGIAYSQTLTATSGTSPYIFAVTTGTLPGGLSLSAGGSLIGTPTTAGTFTFTVEATDANGCSGERSYTLIVNVGGLMYYPLPRPIRLLETRLGELGCDAPGAPISGGTSRTQTAAGRTCDGITIPSNAKALTGNITTVQSGGGYLTLYPSDAAQPTVANSNYNPNEILNNVFTVGLGATDGAFNIFVTSDTHIVVDVTGYYAPPGAGGLYFHPLPKPIRLLETRPGELGCNTPGMPIQGGVDTPQQARLTCDGVTIPTAARAIVGNAITINPGAGYLTLFPADATRPLVASSNYSDGQIMNAPFTVGLSPGGEFNIFATGPTELVIDVLGYYSPEANDVNGVGLLFNPLSHPVRLLETRDNPAFPGCYKPNAPIQGGVERTQPARGVCDGLTIPSNALGIVGNATVVNSNGGYLTFWPSDATQPLVATSNFSAGQVFNRHFIVGLSVGPGAFKIFSAQTTDLVIDVTGYFAP